MSPRHSADGARPRLRVRSRGPRRRHHRTAAPRRTLIAVGDIASCTSNGDEQTAALVSRIPGTIAVLGDIAYENGSEADFANCFEPSWGKLVPRIRAALGNHEYNTAGAAPAFKLFGLPPNGWYSYSLGAWHVIVLNSNCSAGRRLRARLAAGPLAPGRSRGAPRPLHARVLASPAVQLGLPRLRRDVRAVLGHPRAREGRRRAPGPRPRLRALRAAEGDPLVRRRHGRQGPLPHAAPAPRQHRPQRHDASACSG